MLAVDTTTMAANAYEDCPTESQPTTDKTMQRLYYSSCECTEVAAARRPFSDTPPA